MAVMLKHMHSPVANLRQTLPGCPETLARVVTKMMAKQPYARQQTHSEVIADLRRAYDGLGGAAMPAVVAVTQQPARGAGNPAREFPVRSNRKPQNTNHNSKGPSFATLAGGGLALLATVAALVYFAPWKKARPQSEAERAMQGRAGVPPAAPGILPGASDPGRTPISNPPPATSDVPGRIPGTAGSIPALPATKDLPFVNTLGMKFVPVSGTNARFCIWETRVRDYAEYARAKTVDGSWQSQQKDGTPLGREPEHPVGSVNWENANGFCAWLTEKEIAEGKLPKGMKYRLPTDEEWSRAVGLPRELPSTPKERSGKDSANFPWGTAWPPKGKADNYADESFHGKFSKEADKWIEGYTDGFATTAPVVSFDLNQFGIHDLGGNVSEWCEDVYDLGSKDSGGQARVLRGASWYTSDRGTLLSSHRNRNTPVARNNDYGFRCVVDVSALSAAQPATTAPQSGSGK